jgi:hypothetical protein
LRSTKAVALQAALLITPARAAGARVIAAKLFDQFLVAMDDTLAALDGGFTVEIPSGACSSIQKLNSWFLRAMSASCR